MNRKRILIIFFTGLFLYFLFSKFINTELVYKSFRVENSSLKEVVEKATAGTKGTYAIVIKNLKTNEGYTQNEDRVFEAGSLYKLWVLLTAFDQIEKGELKEDEFLSQNVSIINRKFDISSDSAEMTSGSINLNVKDAMNQMITISHNYAALILSDRIGLSKVTEFLKEHQFNNSSIGEPPQTTATDIALFLERLYKGELANQENTQKILDLLKKQQLNDGLPKYLPLGTQVAHKTGDIGWFKHDAGIVFLEKGEYIIVVLSESDSPPGALERIAEISKAVYEYFK